MLDKIATLFVRDAGDSFGGDETTIRVTLRIAIDFWHFLETHKQLGDADGEEVDYAVNTIRSGMDDFFTCEEHYRVLAKPSNGKHQWAMHSRFPTLREEYLEVFAKMRNDDLSFIERLSTLLRLVELQLQFTAAYFHHAQSNRSLG